MAYAHPPPKIILAVDDEPTVLTMIQIVFSGSPDVRLLTATDSQMALHLIRQMRPHLVTSDICRPDMDGIEFLRRVRRDFPALPVVMISARLGHPRTRAEARAAGAAACIDKPFTISELRAVVRRLLARRRRSPCRMHPGRSS